MDCGEVYVDEDDENKDIQSVCKKKKRLPVSEMCPERNTCVSDVHWISRKLPDLARLSSR
jgi:hypothetical protein